MPASIRDRSVKPFQGDESALGRVVAYSTFSSCASQIGYWTGVIEIIRVLGAFLGAVSLVSMALF